MALTERKRKILHAIILEYVNTAEPVGSRAVVRKHGLKMSAATARNEMADLEEMGYLEQPHTSSGRIPSERGFRYYVDCMMEKEKLAEKEVEIISKILKENVKEWNDFIHKIGTFLSRVTNYASFVVLPSMKFTQFQYLQLVPIQPGWALLIVVTDIGLILHRKIEIPAKIEINELHMIGEAFSNILRGKKMIDMSRTELQGLRDDLTNRRKVIDLALEALENLLENSSEDIVVVSGVLNIFKEPEFKDIDKLKKILTLLKEEDLIRDLIPDFSGEDVNISIGKENKFEDIQEMSLVSASYKTLGEAGKIGLLGPVRMEYWKAAGTIDSVKDIIEEVIREKLY